MPYIQTIRRNAPNRRLSKRLGTGAAAASLLAALCPAPAHAAAPEVVRSFDGLANIDGYLPPTPSIAVGPDHVVQAVHSSFQVYDKDGAPVGTPRALKSLFSPVPGPCSTYDGGTPYVLYDQLADRFVVTQSTYAPPSNVCIAVSRTADPTGDYWLYHFQLHATAPYDVPMLGLWPDGYYFTFRRLTDVGLYQDHVIVAFQRTQMLEGLPAYKVEEVVPGLTLGVQSNVVPATLSGPTPPEPGTAHVSVARTAADKLGFYTLAVDWTLPGATLSGPTELTVGAHDPLCPTTRQCVPQPDTAELLDGRGGRLAPPVSYRVFSDHAVVTANHSVDVGSGRAGIRWYDIRVVGDSPSIEQEATFAPLDAVNRWNAGIAVNGKHSMALGYNVSSDSVYPGIAATGRLSTDADGQMPGPAVTVQSGSGSQTSSTNRWGDHAIMTVDPADDCTFWFTSEYYDSTSATGWKTRIAALSLDTCPATTPSDAGADAAAIDGGSDAAATDASVDASAGGTGGTGGTGSAGTGAGAGGEGAGGNAGGSGGTAIAGSGGVPAGAGGTADATDAGTSPADAGDDSGCGCRQVGAAPSIPTGRGSMLAALIAMVGMLARRRGRSGSDTKRSGGILT